MGYNTGVLIMNDALNEIKEDEHFATNFYNAICCFRGNPKDFRIGNHANGGLVFCQAHADYINLCYLGGNTAQVIDYVYGPYCVTQIDLLKSAAKTLGYRLVKKST